MLTSLLPVMLRALGSTEVEVERGTQRIFAFFR